MYKHGHTKWNKGAVTMSRTYRTWLQMRYRCRTHPNYAGRGITVCRRWDKFENFLADMGERPADMTLDRRSNDKGYCKSNCRWATRKEQQNNLRNNTYYRGKPIAYWQKVWGLTHGGAWSRISRSLSK